MIEPPELIVSTALNYASFSPCAKSKRGVVIFDRGSPGVIYGTGFNGPPRPFVCDGSDACRRDCGAICVHAEMRALLAAQRPSEFSLVTGEPEIPSTTLELVHVKAGVRGELVAADGGPTCEQCSRLILDVGIAHVWIYEAKASKCPGCRKFEDSSLRVKERLKRCPDCGAALVTEADWYAYTAAEFHRETLRNLELYAGKPRDVHSFVRQIRSPRYCAACGEEECIPVHRV